MPEPFSKKFASDQIVYDTICTPLAKRICFVNPNVITFIGLILGLLSAYVLFSKGNPYIFVGLIALRAFIDCLDGAVARGCDSTSDFGAKFDIMSDFVFAVAICLAIIYRFLRCQKYTFFNSSMCVAAVIVICVMFKATFLKVNYNEFETTNNMIVFFHDNTIMWMTIASIIVVLLLKFEKC